MNPIVMTILLLVGWGAFAYSARRRWKLLTIGAPANRFDRPGERLARMWKYAILQIRMRRYPLAGVAHMLIFMGFAVLLPRTLVLWGRGFDSTFDLWILGTESAIGKIYAFFKDIFAVLVICGTLVFFYFRLVKRLPRLTHSGEGLLILGIIITMMLADIAYDGATIARASGGAPSFILYEPAASLSAKGLALLPDGLLAFLAQAGFWMHSTLVLIFLNLLPYSKHFHIITGVPNVYLQNLEPVGRLPNIEDIDGKLEREETLGIRRIEQFSWKSILDFYSCTECGRCSDHCPATKTGKKLSPKHFTLDLRDFLYKNERALVASQTNGHGGAGHAHATQSEPEAQATGGDPASSGNGNAAHKIDLVDGVIDPEVLWACTSCRACEQECPVFITYVDKIVDMRRYLVQERGEFPSQLQSAFRGLETNANPWNFAAADRGHWAEGMDIKLLAENPDVPLLFWVGCMPSFDERAKKITQATARLMQQAGVDFAILGAEEQCTGDPARRAGNEYLFQMFAKANVEVLNNYGVDKKTVVTTCPHCFNTLLNEYPDFGGRFNVVHHTTFLSGLLAEGKLKPARRLDRKVAFHDSCYLGRYNEVYEAPREALRRIGLTVLEPTATRDRGMCCGAGGAQMFKEEEHGTERVNIVRTEQLLETQPDAVASACPFCMRMLTDGLASKGRENVPQLDISELLLEAMSPA